MQDNECGRLHSMVSSNIGNMERTVVGERDLKTRLGTYLRRVREQRTLLVTDRGDPRISPPAWRVRRCSERLPAVRSHSHD
jgi:antitoxin (DNA-binding transcriptional repressor) of toxin-antitoxin stability system